MGKTKSKPAKPYPDFPLTAHNNGQWCKKIRGKVRFFGVWGDPDGALANYCEVRDDLQAGRQSSDAPTLADVCNTDLLRAKERQDPEEISPRTYHDYFDACRLLIEQFGKTADPAQLRPSDFASSRAELARRYSPNRLSKVVSVTRMVLTCSNGCVG